MNQKPSPKTEKSTSTPIGVNPLKDKINLSSDTRFWMTVLGFLLAPIVLTYVVYGFFSWSPVILGLLLRGVVLIFLLAAIGLIFFLIPTLILWEIVKTIQLMIKDGFNEGIALAVPLCIVILGISLGGALQAGYLYPLWLMLAGGVAIPLAVTIIYLPLRRLWLIRQYRQSEQHLIKP